MYRLLGKFLPAQRTADARQEQPPTKRPSKGTNRPGKSVVGTVETTAVHTMLGRPVTSAGQRNATPIGVAFLAFAPCRSTQRVYRLRAKSIRQGLKPALILLGLCRDY